MAVNVPIKTTYNGEGFDKLRRDAQRAEREAIAATRRQISEHKSVLNLTKQLDKDLAGGGKKASFKDQIGEAVGGQLLAANALNTILEGVKDFNVGAIQAARESAAAEAELEAVIRSTGGAAGVSKAQLEAHAEALERVTNFSDEAVNHAQSVLLTFTKIGKDVFPEATEAVADIAELMDGDLQGAAVQVGKALNDPINGISALTRVGVSFTEQQKNQIKAMVEAGDVAGAQKLILAELNKEFGGQAEAAREAAGGWKDLEVSAGQFQEAWGKLISELGDAGITDLLVGSLDALTKGAEAWTSVVQAIELLTEAQNRLNEEEQEHASILEKDLNSANEWLKVLNPLHGLISEGAELFGAYTFAQEQLAEKVQEVVEEEEAAEAAANAYAKKLQDEAAAAEADAAAQEELAKKLEKANQARRDTARELLDITQEAAIESSQTWQDYYKDVEKADADHAEKIEGIEAEAAKRRTQIQADLAKELADNDKDLQKALAQNKKDLAHDLAKLDKDTNLKAKRMQEDAAREEKRQARARKIDHLADERLFQFELRQMAAEGQANAIQAALERRKIEQEIEAKKSQEEDRSQEEDTRLELDRLREDAEMRRQELEAEAAEEAQRLEEQAAERAQQLQEQAAEELARNEERRQEELAAEQEAYTERLAQLAQYRDEKLAEIQRGKEEAIAEVADELTQIHDLSREEMEALKPMAYGLGEDVGTAFAEGLSGGFKENQKINEMLDGLKQPGQKINPAHPTTSTNIGAKPAPKPTKSIYGFAEGGRFLVGGAGGTDSQLVQFMASPWEEVQVRTPGQQQGSPAAAGGLTMNLVVDNMDLANRLRAALLPVAEAVVEEYHESIIKPWAQGR
ncbi:MAG: hypothetical protein BroJett011_04040 [Chloroflexota bacterium]|nr:MAG: hypothetical protein BroJett011_04040 [Chloroflexota bacterium]